MLMPIIAAVGSFVVSERILKPKATALFVLACLAVYDVFISPPVPMVPSNASRVSHAPNAPIGGSASAGLMNGTAIGTNSTETNRITSTEEEEFHTHSIHQTNPQSHQSHQLHPSHPSHLSYQSYQSYQYEEDDLSTSFRCYRGPALLAVTLFCSAYCLRVWRRNGVACDELLFLPGTPHEFRCIGGVGGVGAVGKLGTTGGESGGVGGVEGGVGKDGFGGKHSSLSGSGSSSSGSLEMSSLEVPDSASGNLPPAPSSARKRQTIPSVPSVPNNPPARSSSLVSPMSQNPSYETSIGTSFSEGDAAAGMQGMQGMHLSGRGRLLDEGDRRHSSDELETRETRSLLHNGRAEMAESAEITPNPSMTSITSITSDPSIQESPLYYIRDRAQSLVEAGFDMLVVPELRPPPFFRRDSREMNDNAVGAGSTGVVGAAGAAGSDGAQSSSTTTVAGSGAGVAGVASGQALGAGAAPATTENYDVEYSPSGPSVLGAALDLSLPVLFNFHMFVVLMKDHYKTEAEEAESAELAMAESALDGTGDGIDGMEGTEHTDEMSKMDVKTDAYTTLTSMTPPQIPPKVLPLIFLSATLVRSQIPRKQRMRFYKTLVQGTLGCGLSLFQKSPSLGVGSGKGGLGNLGSLGSLGRGSLVTFRDAFVGDCITSLVRPIVDVVFAIAYYGAAVWALLAAVFRSGDREFDLNEVGYRVNHSQLLHGLILPVCAILPLWWRFLQTLRQAYDTGKRWPYLGNAFKYLSAALVIQHGMTHAAGHRGHWWTFSFFLCTMYQILWDSCMDWELLVIVPRSEPELDESRESVSLVPGWVGRWFGWMVRWRCPSFVSSLSPRLFPSRLLGCLILPFRKRISTPLANLFRKFRDSLPSLPRWDQIRLRPRRLFDDDSFYWRALLFNAASRFCWMMGFIPAYRVSILDGSMQVTWATNGLGGFGGLSGMQSWSFVILAVIEIFRRSIWGIIKVELETIKLTSGGENDLAMASTADEYLREGMWNAWRGGEKNRNGLGSKKNLAVEVGHSMQDRNLDAGVEDSNEEEYIPLRQNKSDLGLKSPTSGNAPLNQSYQWLGMTVSRRFMRWAYFVELCIWPLAYVVLSYYVVSSE